MMAIMLTVRILVLIVTSVAVVLIGLLPRILRALSRPMRMGDRIRLSGDYGSEPAWLGTRASVDGEVITFVSRGGPRESAIIKLTVPVSADGVSSDIVALDLRYQGVRWGQREVVHGELRNNLPSEDERGTSRGGKWVESHAQYRVLR